MSQTLELVRNLVAKGEILVSEHGYDELAADNIQVREVIEGLSQAVVVEDYPDYHKGPCVLVLQQDETGQPVHIVWGIPKGKATPAVLVTSYRPDPEKWTADFRRRVK